jgi:hypothetical protein
MQHRQFLDLDFPWLLLTGVWGALSHHFPVGGVLSAEPCEEPQSLQEVSGFPHRWLLTLPEDIAEYPLRNCILT